MRAEDVKALLPVIKAFADKQPVQVKSSLTKEWTTLNPDTTEFRFSHLEDSALQWRVPNFSA